MLSTSDSKIKERYRLLIVKQRMLSTSDSKIRFLFTPGTKKNKERKKRTMKSVKEGIEEKNMLNILMIHV